MKPHSKGVAKRLLFSFSLAAALAGCAVYEPYPASYQSYDPYGLSTGYPYSYSYPYGAPYYGGAPYYVGPPVWLGLWFGSFHGGGHGGHHGHFGHGGWGGGGGVGGHAGGWRGGRR